MTTTTKNFRPTTFSEVVGQNEVKEALRLKVSVYRKSGRAPGHILLLGPRGLGKTTLSQIVAQEMGTTMHFVDATSVRGNFQALLRVIKNAKDGDVVFIDEIHALNPSVQETLYGIMEDYSYAEWDPYFSINRVNKLPRFALIGATTHGGNLNQPLLDRFEYIGYLSTYSEAELTQLVHLSAYRRWSVDFPSEVARVVARLSKGNARNADRLMRNVYEVAQADSPTGYVDSLQINNSTLDRAVRMLRLDPMVGLDYLSRKYLVELAGAGAPVGSKSIANMLNEQESTVINNVEPYLVQDVQFTFGGQVYAGPLIKLTPRGRVVTPNGVKYLEACKELQVRNGYFPNEKLAF
jgi:holliday junction DNA helicase RuvB